MKKNIGSEIEKELKEITSEIGLNEFHISLISQAILSLLRDRVGQRKKKLCEIIWSKDKALKCEGCSMRGRSSCYWEVRALDDLLKELGE